MKAFKTLATVLLLGGYTLIYRVVSSTVSREFSLRQFENSESMVWNRGIWEMILQWSWVGLVLILALVWLEEIGAIVKWFKSDTKIGF